MTVKLYVKLNAFITFLHTMTSVRRLIRYRLKERRYVISLLILIIPNTKFIY